MDWYLQVLKKYAEFKGRARRKEYWYFFLFNFLIYVCLAVLAAFVKFLIVLYVLYGLAVLIPGLAVSVRRLHDGGKSGFWFFIVLVPFLGALVLLYFMVQPSQPQANEYGPVPQ